MNYQKSARKRSRILSTQQVGNCNVKSSVILQVYRDSLGAHFPFPLKQNFLIRRLFQFITSTKREQVTSSLAVTLKSGSCSYSLFLSKFVRRRWLTENRTSEERSSSNKISTDAPTVYCVMLFIKPFEVDRRGGTSTPPPPQLRYRLFSLNTTTRYLIPSTAGFNLAFGSVSLMIKIYLKEL